MSFLNPLIQSSIKPLNTRILLSQSTKAGRILVSWTKFSLIIFVGAYRTIGNLFMGGACRFEPSCSEYALGTLKTHDPISAIKIILIRLYRCRPGGGMGYDPVPMSSVQNEYSQHKNCRGHHETT